MIAVVAVMRPVTGTQRMEMKFVLQRRDAGAGSFATVQGGDLGRWLEPNSPTLGQHANDVWRLRKLVANLPGPATYRFRVSFRWLGAGRAPSWTAPHSPAPPAQSPSEVPRPGYTE